MYSYCAFYTVIPKTLHKNGQIFSYTHFIRRIYGVDLLEMVNFAILSFQNYFSFRFSFVFDNF